MILSDAEKLVAKSFLSEILQRIDSQWSDENCARLAATDDAFTAYDDKVAVAQDSLREISTLLNDSLRDITARIDQAIYRTSRHRNHLPPINRLPLEILRAIFQITSSCGEYHRDNVSLSAVCKHWRTVVLHDAQMWTYLNVDVVQEEYATMASERCGSLPLRIINTYSEFTEGWVLPFVGANLSRVQRLELKVWDWEQLRPYFDNAHAPQLTHFLMEQSCLEALDSDDEDGEDDVHPLSTVHLPALRSLELVNCRHPWSTDTLANLTCLRLLINDTDEESINSYFPGGDIAFVVRECPKLEELIISFDFGETFAEDVPLVARRTSRLSNLRELRLQLPEQHMTYLLGGVILPPTLKAFDIDVLQCTSTNIVGTMFHPLCIPPAFISKLSRITTSGSSDSYDIRGTSIDTSLRVCFRPPGESQQQIPTLLLSTIRTNYSLPHLESAVFQLQEDCWHSTCSTLQIQIDYAREVVALAARSQSIQTLSLDLGTGLFGAMALNGLCDTLSDTFSSSGEWLLPNLTKFSLTSTESCASSWIPALLRFLTLVNSHRPLAELQIECGCIPIETRKAAYEFVGGIRALRIPATWWTETYFLLEHQSTVEFTAGDLWPRSEEYTWRCDQDHEHRKRKLPVTNCCRGSNPLNALGTLRNTVDMYDIADDWAHVTPMDADETVI